MDPEIADLLAKSFANEIGGDVALALQSAQQALDLAKARDSSPEIAAALVRLSGPHYRLGHYGEAEALAKQALAYAPSNCLARADALRSLGMCAAAINDLAAAEDYFREAIDLYRQLGARKELFMTLHTLATNIYRPRGQFDLSLDTDEQSYRVCLELDDAGAGVTAALVTLAFVNQIIGQRERAHRWLDELSRRVEPQSMPMGYHHVIAAELAMDEDDMTGALDFLSRCHLIAESTGEPSVNILLRLGLTRWHRLSGQVAAALNRADDAVASAGRVGYHHFEGQALIARAQAELEANDSRAAETDLHSAVKMLKPLGAAYDLACATLLLAVLHHAQAHSEAEALWLDAALRIQRGGYGFLLERERARAFPLIAAQLRTARPEARAMAEKLLEHLARVPPLPLHVVGLGRFEVRQGTRVIPARAWERRKAGELFRFLILQAGRAAARDLVLEALWPEDTPDSSESLFYQATSALRRILEPDLPERFPSRYLQVEAEQVTLQLPPGSTVDFEEFGRRLTQALATQELGPLTQALSLYSGELFPIDRYANWAAAPREHQAQLELRGMLALASLYLSAGQPQQALDVCRRIHEREPWLEDAVLIGMQACLALKDRPGALRLYRALESTLREDLGISPREDLRALAASLKN
jgi:DNA-binding SARP family transcriptional activator